MDKDVSPLCDSCNLHCPETVQHYLIECPAHENPRKALKDAVVNKTKDTFTMNALLGDNLMYGCIQRAVLDFLVKTGKYDII